MSCGSVSKQTDAAAGIRRKTARLERDTIDDCTFGRLIARPLLDDRRPALSGDVSVRAA
jgi:hypothetical protein